MIDKISDEEIEKATAVLESLTVDPLSREGALESLFFCIASQAMKWEQSAEFIHNLRQVSKKYDGGLTDEGYCKLNLLIDERAVNENAKDSGYRFHKNNRFASSINHFGEREDKWWEEIKDATPETREKYVKKVKYIGRKTFSFWHKCLGGKNLLALDRHVLRCLKEEFRITVPLKYIKPRKSIHATVIDPPNKSYYLKIEREAKDLFSCDERFLTDSRNVNLSLVDTILWWRRASREGNQIALFSNLPNMPYSS